MARGATGKHEETPDPAASLVAQVDWSGGEIRGKATNISMKGLFVETEGVIDVDEPVMIEFAVIVDEEPRTVIASGHVVRAFDATDTISGRIRSGLGIRFELILSGKGSLKAFIRQRARRAMEGHNLRVERRSQARVDASLPVAWKAGRAGDWRHGYLLRLPANAGFVVETPTLVSTGTRVMIRVDLPVKTGDARIDARARVAGLMSSQDQAGGMIVDLDLNPVDVALITRYAKLSASGTTAGDPPARRQARA